MIMPTRYHNDGKEKYQSHELHVEGYSIFKPDYSGNLDLTGYGANKDEATANLRAALQHLIHDAQETLASLPTPEVPEPQAVNSEFDAAFVNQLDLAIRIGQRKLKDAQDPEFQQRKFAHEIKTQLVETASHEHRRHVLHVPRHMRDTAELIFKQCADRFPGFMYKPVFEGPQEHTINYSVEFPPLS